jgi:hypothetical protein
MSDKIKQILAVRLTERFGPLAEWLAKVELSRGNIVRGATFRGDQGNSGHGGI